LFRSIRSFTVVSAMSRIVPDTGHRSREDPGGEWSAPVDDPVVFPPLSDFVSESPAAAVTKRRARLRTPPVSSTSSKCRARSGGQERSAASIRPTRLVLTHTRWASSRWVSFRCSRQYRSSAPNQSAGDRSGRSGFGGRGTASSSAVQDGGTRCRIQHLLLPGSGLLIGKDYS